jgi:uncharacterized membrane protein
MPSNSNSTARPSNPRLSQDRVQASAGPGRWASLAELGPALALLAALPFALVLGYWSLTGGDAVAGFLLQNELGRATRESLFGISAGLSGLSLASSLALVLLRRISVARLYSVALRLSPLLPLALSLLLLHWEIWQPMPRRFLIMVLAVGWALHRALRAALVQPPLWRWDRLKARLAHIGLRRRAGTASWIEHLLLSLIVAGGLGYAIYFSYFTILAHHNGLTHSYDLAIFDNLHWNIVHGGSFLKSSPATGPEGTHFVRHATLIAYVFAPIYALAQRAETLLVLQATLLGSAVIPLFAFARRLIGSMGAAVISIAYLLYPQLHGSNLFGFHFLTLAPFFAFSLAYAIETEKRWLIVLTTVLTLSVREDVALVVAILGAWQILERKRARLGGILLLAGATYFAITKFLLMPIVESHKSFAHLYESLTPGGEGGFGQVIRTLLINPAYGFGVLLTPKKLLYTLQIMVPLSFLPLRRSLGALFILPGLLFTLLSDHHPVFSISFQYTAFWTPYLFVACVVCLRPRTGPGLPLREARLRSWIWLATVALTGVLCSYQFGALFQRNTATGGFDWHPRFVTTETMHSRRAAREEAIRLLPPEAKVAASETVVPHVSNRRDAYTLRSGIHDAEYILVALNENLGDEQRSLRRPLQKGTFGVVVVNREFALLREGAETDRNPWLLRRIFGRR